LMAGQMIGNSRSSSNEDAERIRARANAIASSGMRDDMRRYLIEAPEAALSEWAAQSEWARGTGGDVDEATGAPKRALSGVWKELWEQVQQEELLLLQRLRGSLTAARQAAATEAELQGKLSVGRQKLTSVHAEQVQLRAEITKLQERLHSVLQARRAEREDEQARHTTLTQALEASEVECARLRRVLAYQTKEQAEQREAAERRCATLRTKLRAEAERLRSERDSRVAELRVSLAANEHIQAEYDGLHAQMEIVEERAAHFERRFRQLQAVVAMAEPGGPLASTTSRSGSSIITGSKGRSGGRSGGR
jgi:hypothetical protein